MPIVSEFPEGTPLWIDLQTTSSAEAAEFYAALLGWRVEEPSRESAGYRFCWIGDQAVCAIGELPELLVERGAQPVWTSYLAVADADAAAAAVPEAGGSVLLAPGIVNTRTRLLLATDPAGAVIGLWEGEHPSGGWVREEHGSVGWFELLADDVDRALPFYEEVLGLAVGEMEVGGTSYPLIGVADEAFAGAGSSDLEGMPAHWRVYFEVDDLDAAVESVTQLGGSVLGERASAEGVGSWVAARDPQGALFSLIQSELEPGDDEPVDDADTDEETAEPPVQSAPSR